MKKLAVENGRPDKPVPCPRCQSLNTTFCYFNNYNVKQPRHFCRECQRYWTVGGSLRNVPIGAGRRKHKIASTLSSKLHGSAEATKLKKLNNGVDNKCVYISSIEPNPSLPFKRLVTCNSNGNISQEVRSLMGMQCTDVISVCGSTQPWLSQVLQKTATNVTENSSASMASDTHRSNTMQLTLTLCDTQGPRQLGFSDFLQNSARKTALETKATTGNGADTLASPLGHVDTGQSEVADFMDDDACNKDESSHISNTCKLPPSNGVVIHDSQETIVEAEQGESDRHATPLASSASQAAIALSGSSCTKLNLPSANRPLGLESTPAFWGPLMWPWIWPFFVSGANAAQVDPNWVASLGALVASVVPHAEQANNPSHINMACSPTVGPSFPHWPYAWNPLPWGSPWNMAWNATNVGHSFLPQGPAKEKQGLLCIPKTLRMDRPDEAAHSSILRTLGVMSLPQSSSGFLNTFQPKADVFQPKLVVPKAVEHSELHHHHPLPHVNPAAQARSVAFQEGS